MYSQNGKVTFSIIGAGGRASAYLAALDKNFVNQFSVEAIAEPDINKQERYKTKYNIKAENVFDGYEELCNQERLSDVAIVATLDDMHFEPVKKLLKKGYDIILEKPIAMDLKEIVELGEIAKDYPNQVIVVCHVLRYTKFFKTLKSLIDKEVVGKVVNIQHNENIGYYHFAHSYVRGSWRNTDIAAPLVVAKSCHDMDILLYLLGHAHCTKVSSYGNLSFFNHDHYDENTMAKRCVDCPQKNTCPYSAVMIYGSKKVKSMVFDTSSEENIRKSLGESLYGRCVFACDNNVVDHQVTILEFDNKVNATFNLSAFTNKINRSLKIMCEYGEIRAIEKPYQIEYQKFGSNEVTKIDLDIQEHGHGGGDENFMIEFMNSYMNNKQYVSTLEQSIESHVMAFGAEYSRVNDGNFVDINNYWQQNCPTK